MFGFLFKVLLIATIVAGVLGIIYIRRGSLPEVPKLSEIPSNLSQAIRNVDTKTVAQNLSLALDNLVTHPDKNSPVVLGVKVTSDSIVKVVDILYSLPPDQLTQIKSLLCTPASPSAR